MGSNAANFMINETFNANYDITWSFDYNINGAASNASGGFSTFLISSDYLSGGGNYAAMGMVNTYDSQHNIILKGVDYFGLGATFNTSTNKMDIYFGAMDYPLSSFSLPSALSPLKSTKFNTLRFNLTNLAQRLIVSYKNSKGRYIKFADCDMTNMIIITDTFKLCFGYSNKISDLDSPTVTQFGLIHYQGNNTLPKTVQMVPPITFTEANYVLQSPASGKVLIGNHATSVSLGKLLHN